MSHQGNVHGCFQTLPSPSSPHPQTLPVPDSYKCCCEAPAVLPKSPWAEKGFLHKSISPAVLCLLASTAGKEGRAIPQLGKVLGGSTRSLTTEYWGFHPFLLPHLCESTSINIRPHSVSQISALGIPYLGQIIQ